MQSRRVQCDICSLWARDDYRIAGAVTNDYTGVFSRLFGDAVHRREHSQCLIEDAVDSTCEPMKDSREKGGERTPWSIGMNSSRRRSVA